MALLINRLRVLRTAVLFATDGRGLLLLGVQRQCMQSCLILGSYSWTRRPQLSCRMLLMRHLLGEHWAAISTTCRLSTSIDQIFSMGEGVVLEQGTHQKPLANICPPYSNSEALKEQNWWRTRSRQRYVHCGEGRRHEEPLLVVTLFIR